jgi:hypothetical protein
VAIYGKLVPHHSQAIKMSRKFAAATLFSVSAVPARSNEDEVDLKGVAEWRSVVPTCSFALRVAPGF